MSTKIGTPTQEYPDRLGFAAPSRGSEEFAALFRASALRYLLPLSTSFAVAYILVTLFTGGEINLLVYGLLACCSSSAALARWGKRELALRLFIGGGLLLILLYNHPGLGRPSGFATGGIYLVCLFPITWWVSFAERRSRLLMLTLSIACIFSVGLAAQPEELMLRVPNTVVVMGMVRCLFIIAILGGTCHAIEMALNRYEIRWRNSFKQQEQLAQQLARKTRALEQTDQAHRATLDHLSRSENRLRYLFDRAFDGIIVFNAQTRRSESINAAFCTRLGYTEAELMRSSPLRISPTLQPDGRTSRDLRDEVVGRLAAGESFAYEWQHLSKTGEPVDFEVTTFPLDHEPNIRISVFRDVTDLKRSRVALERVNSELQSFAHAASHDLKEPLRTMGAFASILSRRYGETIDEDGQSYLTFINDAAKHGTSLVSDLLNYAGASLSEVKQQPVNLTISAETVRQLVHARLQKEGAQLHIGPLPTVMATPTWAQQLLQNLISNALKFTPAGVAPVVTVTATSNALGHEIRVKDNGIGIDPADADRVFGAFARLNNREEYEGSGLGLSLCHRIMTHLGGDIRIEPQEERGTTFVLWFPTLDEQPDALLNTRVEPTTVAT